MRSKARWMFAALATAAPLWSSYVYYYNDSLASLNSASGYTNGSVTVSYGPQQFDGKWRLADFQDANSRRLVGL